MAAERAKPTAVPTIASTPSLLALVVFVVGFGLAREVNNEHDPHQ